MTFSSLHVFSLMMTWNKILAILIGKISNVSLVIVPINTTINTTTCNECICNMFRSPEILSLNCFQTNSNQVMCTMFTNDTYTSAVNYRLERNGNSTFYFRQLPVELSTTTTTHQRSWIPGAITRSGDPIVGLYNTTAGAFHWGQRRTLFGICWGAAVRHRRADHNKVPEFRWQWWFR